MTRNEGFYEQVRGEIVLARVSVHDDTTAHYDLRYVPDANGPAYYYWYQHSQEQAEYERTPIKGSTPAEAIETLEASLKPNLNNRLIFRRNGYRENLIVTPPKPTVFPFSSHFGVKSTSAPHSIGSLATSIQCTQTSSNTISNSMNYASWTKAGKYC